MSKYSKRTVLSRNLCPACFLGFGPFVAGSLKARDAWNAPGLTPACRRQTKVIRGGHAGRPRLIWWGLASMTLMASEARLHGERAAHELRQWMLRATSSNTLGTRLAGRKKETKSEQETKGGAGGPTETHFLCVALVLIPSEGRKRKKMSQPKNEPAPGTRPYNFDPP